MDTAFVIWTIVSAVFLVIGVSSWKSEDIVGFFQGIQPPKMKDVKKYNHAVAKIWFVFAVLLELIGIPLLFMEQNSPFAFLVVFAVVVLLIGTIIVYFRVEKKYRE